MSMRIQIQDKNGNIIQDDELVVETGDILLCQLQYTISSEEIATCAEKIHNNFKNLFKQARFGNEIIPVTYDKSIEFKVLKIRTE